jgi:hypothetical protein
MSAAVPLIDVVPVDAEREFDIVLTGIHTGLVFSSLQILFLGWRWRVLTQKFKRTAQLGSGPVAATTPVDGGHALLVQ